jgi:hypothetical protein
MSQNKKFYSAESVHGSSSSFGFANDIIVYVWDSKKNRDEYISNTSNISATAIKRCDVTKEANNWSLTQNCGSAPRPFSGEFWGIVKTDLDKPGIIGEIECCSEFDNFRLIDRFY